MSAVANGNGRKNGRKAKGKKPPAPKPPGRPPKILEEVNGKTIADLIVDDLTLGLPQELACARAGIGTSTYYRWLARGGEWAELPLDEVPEEQRPYREFRDAVEKARADALLVRLANIRRAGQGTPAEYDSDGNLLRPAREPQWTADAWWAERQFPQHFGRRVALDHSGEVKNPGATTIDLTALSDEEYLELERLTRKARGAVPEGGG